MKRIAAFALLALACTDATASGVRCHVIYGGENFTVDATPTTDPYRFGADPIVDWTLECFAPSTRATTAIA